MGGIARRWGTRLKAGYAGLVADVEQFFHGTWGRTDFLPQAGRDKSLTSLGEDGLDDALLAGNGRHLEGRAEGDGHVGRADAQDGGVEPIECLGVEDGSELGRSAVALDTFVNYHRIAGLAHRGEQGLLVQRHEGARIDDLGF